MDIKMSDAFDLPVSDGEFTLVAMSKHTYVSMDRAAVIAINSYDANQERMAELEKEVAMFTPSSKYFHLNQAIRDLEQDANACDWIYSNVPDLSNGNYIKIKNRSAELRKKAKALKEQGE